MPTSPPHQIENDWNSYIQESLGESDAREEADAIVSPIDAAYEDGPFGTQGYLDYSPFMSEDMPSGWQQDPLDLPFDDSLARTAEFQPIQGEICVSLMDIEFVGDSTGVPTASTSTESTASSIQPRRRYKCEECGRSFDRARRARDCEDKHRGMKRYRCTAAGKNCGATNCTEAYNSKDLFYEHVNGPNTQCPKCGMSTSKKNFARHMKNKHK